MTALIDAALALVAFTFFASGAAKLLRPMDAAIAVANFGLTRGIHRWAGFVAAAVEISVALLSVAALATSTAALAVAALSLASALLIVFTLLITRSLAAGKSFACNCFGKHSADPISRVEVLRNVLLLALPITALIALAAEQAKLPSSTAESKMIVVGLVIVVALFIRESLAMLAAGRDPFGADIDRWEKRSY